MESDRRRDRDALAHGYLTARYSWLDVTERRETCRAELRAIGARWRLPPP